MDKLTRAEKDGVFESSNLHAIIRQTVPNDNDDNDDNDDDNDDNDDNNDDNNDNDDDW